MMIDKDGLVAFTQRLIRTASPSRQEAEVSAIYAEGLESLGFDEVSVDSMDNVTGTLKGDSPDIRVLFNGHLDHAEPGGMESPYSGEIIDGRPFGSNGPAIWGRGAVDMKGAIAAMAYAGKTIKDAGIRLEKSIAVTAVVREEEARGEGIRFLLEDSGIRADMSVSGEATGLDVCLGHRGKLEYTITTYGKTAHGAMPELGINAIYKMNDFISELRRSYRPPTHPVLGDCTYTVLECGAEPGRLTPITPDKCWIAFDRRYLPSESTDSVQEEIEAIFRTLQQHDPEFKATIVNDKDFPPFYCDEREEVVSLMRSARGTVLGKDKMPRSWRFGVDGTFIHAAGMPCVGLGPGIETFAHTPQDHVPIDQLAAACEIYAEFIKLAAGRE
ncbi:MAG: M20/M25/M40 family metallo-hydrolase [Candidatus Hydrogenedentota bacterium]|nr:MAG: M20/M25/M40 family metallo-hydrolase [Candidatus Hydrogenedentota bacterium]